MMKIREFQHPIRRSWSFRLLDRWGLALPVSRLARLAIQSPLSAFSQVVAELKPTRVQGQSIVVFALPKSGSTLTELILRTFGYIDLMHSVSYRTACFTTDAPASKQLQYVFGWVSAGRPAFAKLHSPFSPCVRGAMTARDLRGFVQIRDIRDALISRYYHIMSDPRHRHHAMLRNLPEIDGIKRSFFGERPGTGDDAIEYFSRWILDWVTPGHFQIIRYEEIRQDLDRFLRRLAETLGRKSHEVASAASAVATDQQRASTQRLSARLRSHGKEFSTFRRGQPGAWREILDKEAIEIVKRHANAALVAAGYERNDRW